MLKAFSPDRPLVLVGCGNMGHAMAIGWLRGGLPANCLYVVDPFADPGRLPGLEAGQFAKSAEELPPSLQARVLVLAVKPQMMEDVLPVLSRSVGADTLVVSVAAGVTLETLAKGIGVGPSYVRVMPNTPAAIGAGVSGLAADSIISVEDKALAQELMRAVGETVWVADETLIDAVTGVSGSGPAYVFYMVECLAAAGARAGLPEDAAMKLARATIVGAAKLLDDETDVSAAELRRRVTSPGGTTAAALSELMNRESGLGDLMIRAVEAARARGEALGRE